MALTIPYSFTNATIAEAGEVNSNNTAIKAFVDALQTGVGLDPLAITTAKIDNDAVTADKLADTAVVAGAYTTADITVDAHRAHHRGFYWYGSTWWGQRPNCFRFAGVWLMTVWTPPQINALKTTDARTLQQIFFSLSQELGKMGKEIEQLKIDVSKNDRQQYQRIK
jgi:hypothetical protein